MMVKSNSGMARGPSSAMAAFTARSRLSQDFSGAGAAVVGRFLMLALVMAIIGGSPSRVGPSRSRLPTAADGQDGKGSAGKCTVGAKLVAKGDLEIALSLCALNDLSEVG